MSKSSKAERAAQQLSMQSLNSQEQLEAALRDLMNEGNSTRHAMCRGDAITDRGKRRQLLKMLALTMTPLIVLLGVTFYFLAESATERVEVSGVKVYIESSVEIGRSIHALQRERDQSALYLSNIGPDTKFYLFTRYMETDQELTQLTRWPSDLDLLKRPQFKSLSAFQTYLKNHRNALDLKSPTVFEEMDFYTKNIEIFIRWLYNSITESRFGTIWKSLVAYQKVVTGKEEVGIERAVGSSFLYNGGFEDRDIYLKYIKKTNTFTYSFRSAQNYSPIVKPMSEMMLESNDRDLFKHVQHYRDAIRSRNRSFVSQREATLYYDNMTIYIDILLDIQRSLAEDIIDKLDAQTTEVTANIAVSCIFIVIVIALSPIQIQAVYKQTSDIQSYALTLADKTRELNREKRRTDSLLYQMMPRPIAEQLKNKKDVNAEYFKNVTVFFSEIDGFATLAAECTPMQIVELLKELYGIFDNIIGMFDVYKVETIGDQYMVASGLPAKNGIRHALEIGDMALELLTKSRSLRSVNLPDACIRLRMGIHSGAVMAGVVGLKTPRYCLFGDTVNTASRMCSNGCANKIHISSSSHKMMNKYGNYTFSRRGPVEIKGKGQMMTYWLMQRNMADPRRTQSVVSNDLPVCSTTSKPSGLITVRPTQTSLMSEDTDTGEQSRQSKSTIKSGSRPTMKIGKVSVAPVLEVNVQDLETTAGGNAPSKHMDSIMHITPPSYDELQRAWDSAIKEEEPTRRTNSVQSFHDY